MYIDLVHTQPLFREASDTLVVKYTHPDTGVNLEIPYDDLVNTVIAVDSMLSAEEVAVEEAPAQQPTPPQPATVDETVTAGAPSGLRVMRSRVELDDQ